VLRASLFTDDAREHAVLVTVHHIAADDASIKLLITELLTLYGEAVEDHPPALPRSTTEYADFVRWQQREIAGAAGERQWAYWQENLAAPRQRTELPGDVAAPTLRRFRGATLPFDLPPALSPRIQALARSHQTTSFVVMLSAFQLLLAGLCGVRDVLTGTPVLGRSRPEFLSVVGDFVNVLPVRSRIEDKATVSDLLLGLHQTMLGVLEAQDYPLAWMVRRLHPTREASGQALFNTSFTLLTSDGYGGADSGFSRVVAGTAFTLHPLAFQAGMLDLAMDIFVTDGGMQCLVKYSTDLFTAKAAEGIALRYRAMLEAMLDQPDRSLGALIGGAGEAETLLGKLATRDIRLSLDGEQLRINAPKGALDAADRRAIAAWRPEIVASLRHRQNATAFQQSQLDGASFDHDRSRCVHDLLAISARQYPARIAIIGAGGALRYDALDAQANRLARHLIAVGVRPGALVAVCLERTVDIPVALAAVLKAGAAYVPLDPAHPRERQRDILRDAGVACLITQASLVTGEGLAARIVRLDADADAITACASAPPDITVRPDDLAYVIYTSGSTGRPKGVEVEHRQLVAFLEAMRQRPGMTCPGMTDDDVLLAVTTLSFDIAGLEIWLPISVGARIVLAARAEAVDGARLADLLELHQVSVLQATPATWRLLLESGWAGRPDLRALCGGEALPQALAARLIGLVGALWNMYGPTETTIWSTACRVTDANVASGRGLVPIGRPIAGTTVDVVDDAGHSVPVGVVGELVIGGAGVARGYRGREDLTKNAFFTRDLPSKTERVYRTGDLARLRADGMLEWLGRRDQQIKLRGYRIELAEMAAYPGVTGSCVMLGEAGAGDGRLVGYVTLMPGENFDAESARSMLRAQLPEYMVPSHLVVLPRFPLTPNGKLDRAALPAFEPSSIALVAPATQAQHKVAALWQDVLRLGAVGLHDNFFDLGGHSLLLVELQLGLKRIFGFDIPVIELFQHTTVAKQAARVSAAPGGGPDVLAGARARAEQQAHG
jgi:amino acid adenylation domain-containing protein